MHIDVFTIDRFSKIMDRILILFTYRKKSYSKEDCQFAQKEYKTKKSKETLDEFSFRCYISGKVYFTSIVAIIAIITSKYTNCISTVRIFKLQYQISLAIFP